MMIYAYIDGEIVFAEWDDERGAFVFPKPFVAGVAVAGSDD